MHVFCLRKQDILSAIEFQVPNCLVWVRRNGNHEKNKNKKTKKQKTKQA